MVDEKVSRKNHHQARRPAHHRSESSISGSSSLSMTQSVSQTFSVKCANMHEESETTTRNTNTCTRLASSPYLVVSEMFQSPRVPYTRTPAQTEPSSRLRYRRLSSRRRHSDLVFFRLFGLSCSTLRPCIGRCLRWGRFFSRVLSRGSGRRRIRSIRLGLFLLLQQPCKTSAGVLRDLFRAFEQKDLELTGTDCRPNTLVDLSTLLKESIIFEFMLLLRQLLQIQLG